MVYQKSFNDVPAEIMSEIFSLLNFRDLMNCRYVNRRFYAFSKEDRHWKKFCEKYWLQTECPDGRTWETHFIDYYIDMGKYIHCYASIKQSWDKITSFYKKNCPKTFLSINDGVSELQLDSAEIAFGYGKFPLDMRCSYRLHNGQKKTRSLMSGIMGSLNCRGHYRSDTLLDLESIIRHDSSVVLKEYCHGSIPITFSTDSQYTQHLAILDKNGYKSGTIFYPVINEIEIMKNRLWVDAFIFGNSFQEWLSSHADHLANSEYAIEAGGEPLRILHSKTPEKTTNYISVSVGHCFMPEFSKINPPAFYYCYRITISMSPDAPQSESCRLERAHWMMSYENYIEKDIDGPREFVICPALKPGSSFTFEKAIKFSKAEINYITCTFFLRNDETKDIIEVKGPDLQMNCQPHIYGESIECDVQLRRRKRAKRS